MRFNGICEKPIGIVQGCSLSPFFSNLYLDTIDSELEKKGILFCHYADDYAIGCRTRREAKDAFKFLSRKLHEIGLVLNDKSKLVNLNDTSALNFCGFAIGETSIKVCRQSKQRMIAKTKRLLEEYISSGAYEAVHEFQQNNPMIVDPKVGTVDRSFERQRKKLLKRYNCLKNWHRHIVPSFFKFVHEWSVQQEAAERDDVREAVRPVLEDAFRQLKELDCNYVPFYDSWPVMEVYMAF